MRTPYFLNLTKLNLFNSLLSTSKDKGRVNGQNFNQKLLEFANCQSMISKCSRVGSQVKLENIIGSVCSIKLHFFGSLQISKI